MKSLLLWMRSNGKDSVGQQQNYIECSGNTELMPKELLYRKDKVNSMSICLVKPYDR